MFYKKLIIIFSLCALVSCVNNTEKETKKLILDNDLEAEMIEAYNEGIVALNSGDAQYASKKFNEAELLFPQSEWAPKALLMSAYGYWSQQYYSRSISELERFIEVYPSNQNLDYAYYLMAICYYDSIADEKKDLKSLLESKKYFLTILEKFPNTDYSLDAKYKLDLIQDFMAAKELYIARHYIKKQKWIAAINRLKKIINEYDTTIYIEEALHRLVEIHYKIGLESEAKKYANTLGYNYETSKWYEASYRLFNKNYKDIKNFKQEKKKINLADKIKSFF
ncbi:outer membrane protein assembly factor BamD [Candidatus Pelagibacter sp.]|nr:outer membrane protein assembly factor BamD [Candidatus Pelagibacter sp.]